VSNGLRIRQFDGEFPVLRGFLRWSTQFRALFVREHPYRCNMSLRRLGIVGGILGPLLWLSLIGLAGAMRPEFSHIAHYISELGERGSSTEFLMRYGAFGFTGLLYVCFAAALLAIFRDGWYSTLAAGLIGLDGLGRIGVGVFACDPGCGGPPIRVSGSTCRCPAKVQGPALSE